jgi:hypothetical protein
MGLISSVISDAYDEGIELGLDGDELEEFVEAKYLDLVMDN